MLPAVGCGGGEPEKTYNMSVKGYSIVRDIEFGRVEDTPLLLDMYVPDEPVKIPTPVVVWIHGGGWVGGDKYPSQVSLLAERGFLCVSINYRLSGEAKFPASIEDCKCAIRWLRAHADEYYIDPQAIGVWGSSAGGHLAMLAGCASEEDGLEGDGGWEGYSSRVQAVCSFFGPADLTSLFIPQDCCELIGESLEERADLYTAASPINYVSAGDPPLLMVHGSADYIVPIGQSEMMLESYEDAGLDVKLVRVTGAGHGFFFNDDITPSLDEIEQKVINFFAGYLLGEE